MTRRAVRLFIVLIAIGVTAAAAGRATTNERDRVVTREIARTADTSGAEAIASLADLRATLHAYVAPGQGEAFWAARAATAIDATRARLLEMDEAATAAGQPLSDALDGLDRIAAAERRVFEHVRAGQPRLAGDIIFADARDLIDGVVGRVASARQAVSRAASSRDVGITNEQSLIAGAVLATWILMTILLVPVPDRPRAPYSSATAPQARASTLDLALHPTAPPSPPVAPAAAPAPPVTPLVTPSVTIAARQPEASAEATPGITADQLTALGDLCSSVGRISTVAELEPLLGRAAELLGASGVMVWMVEPDREVLASAASHGYDAETVARIGAVPLSADNAMVAAYTTGRPVTRAAKAGTPGAVAVPLISASGANGVLTAEVNDGRDLSLATAMAGVFAAQLSTLFPAPSVTADPAATKHANA